MKRIKLKNNKTGERKTRSIIRASKIIGVHYNTIGNWIKAGKSKEIYNNWTILLPKKHDNS